MIGTEEGKALASRFAVDLTIRLALLAAVVWVSVALVQPVAGILLWAVILAVAVFPLFALMRRGLPNALSATLLSIALLAVLIGPALVLGASITGTLDDYARMLLRGEPILPPPPDSIRDWPLVGPKLYDGWAQASRDIRALLAGHVGQIATLGRWVGSIAASVAFELLAFAAAIIIAGVMLAYASRLTDAARMVAGRIAGPRGRHFLEIAGSTIRNVSQGVIGVALLQAALLGTGMLMVQVPFAGTITFICLVLAIVQVGPNVVMIPVIIWAWWALPALTAGIFTVYTVPILLLDNVLRPILMARGLQTPMVIILAGVICGTLANGLIGLFIGPVVLAVFYDLVLVWLADGRTTAAEVPAAKDPAS